METKPNARRIILADDEPQVRSFVKVFLQSAHFDVTEASDGIEALEIIEDAGGSFDLLITDVKMPRMDGVTLADTVTRVYPGIPVLLISGYLSDPQLPRISDTGRCDFLPKPFLPTTLLRTVRALLDEES